MPPFETDSPETRGRRDTLLPLAFVLLSGLLLLLPAAFQQRVAAALRGTVLAPFVQLQEGLQRARLRTMDVQLLQARLDSSLAVLVSQSTLRAENERLRELLQIRERESAAFVPASVIRPGTRGSESMFLLDVGTSNGVRVNDPVVVGGGLLGVIREVGPNTSVAMDWTHPDFRVSVMTVDGEGFGIVEPRAGNFREEARLHLVGVPYHTLVPVGAPLVTSGLGSVYPQGILVGWVTELAGTEAGWRRDYWVEPMVRPGSATHVLVFIGEGVLLPSVLQELWLPPGEPEPPLEEEEAAEGLEGAAERLEGGAAAVPELGGGAALPPGDGAPEDPGSPPGSGTLGP